MIMQKNIYGSKVNVKWFTNIMVEELIKDWLEKETNDKNRKLVDFNRWEAKCDGRVYWLWRCALGDTAKL